MKILLTAFTPFDGENINPALEAMKLLPDKIGNLEVIKLEVPTVFGKSAKLAIEKIEREKPDFVLSIGQAGGRAEITPERIAIKMTPGFRTTKAISRWTGPFISMGKMPIFQLCR